ncbi:MAG: TadE/TadG family type IV pilus assembly protein [Chlorobiaceae bacterium]
MHTDHTKLQAPKTEHAQSQKGSVLVEFALILPLFLLLLFGVISFSVALYNKTVLTMATREGARAGAKYVSGRTSASSKSSAIAAATTACQNSLISFGGGMNPAVTTNADPVTDNFITVTAKYNYTGLYVFSGLLISAQTSMRLE